MRVVVGAGVTRALVGRGPKIAPVRPGLGVPGRAVVGRAVVDVARGSGVGEGGSGSASCLEKPSFCGEASSS